jgi:hypothetical protein
VEASKQLILDYSGAKCEKPIYHISGMDEVQCVAIKGTGLGRLFLCILCDWQHSWHKEGIQLLPLGTGIALGWAADPTTGSNIQLTGCDTTLISKQDFRELVEGMVQNVDDFTEQFSNGTAKETVVDLVAACYWPRIRLLEWWRDNKNDSLVPEIHLNVLVGGSLGCATGYRMRVCHLVTSWS